MDHPLNLANHGFHLCACNLVHYDISDLFNDICIRFILAVTEGPSLQLNKVSNIQI